jgi:hypothetical protein
MRTKQVSRTTSRPWRWKCSYVTRVSSPSASTRLPILTKLLGMDKMQRAMTVYVKSLSKRAEGDDREKTLPGGHMGSSMVTHSEDFEPDSEFGMCLSCKYHFHGSAGHVN